MQVRRSTLAALVVGALVVGWLLPTPASTAQIPPDFTFASGESVDRLTVLVEAIVMSMQPAEFARFREALNRIADNEAVSSALRQQAREAGEALERQGRD